jgi:hypothetical protein
MAANHDANTGYEPFSLMAPLMLAFGAVFLTVTTRHSASCVCFPMQSMVVRLCVVKSITKLLVNSINTLVSLISSRITEEDCIQKCSWGVV